MLSIPVCPDHKQEMHLTDTRHGPLWFCPTKGCDMRCWEGYTSTPANAVTRQKRQQCHAAFDPLWRTKSRFKNRRRAYAWLMEAMKLPKNKAHIGMFDADQCDELLKILEASHA